MPLQFDHLVQYVNSDMQETVRRLRLTGLSGTPGGRHERFGTFNSLCYFDLSYIEYLGVENEALCQTLAGENRFLGQLLEDLPKGEGLGTIALRTDRIEQIARHMQAQGVRTNGPFEGQRKRPDASELRWKMMLLESDESKVPLPFIIQWGEADEVRRDDYRERGIIMPHPRGELQIRDISYAVLDLEKTASLWQRWYGFKMGEIYEDEGLQARCLEIPLAGGGLRLCSPLDTMKTNIVMRIIRERGERPFLVRFSGYAGDQREEVCGGLYHFSR